MALKRPAQDRQGHFHYNIKHNAATRLITNCKVCLVVLGNRLKEGIDYEDSFSPVQHAVASRIIMSIAAAADMELLCVDLSQAFIQADHHATGWIVQRGAGHDVRGTSPLVWRHQLQQGTPPHALVVDEESRVGLKSPSGSGWRTQRMLTIMSTHIIMSTHFDDNLMVCKSLAILGKFKQTFLTRFDSTDDKDVNTYLGCEVVRDSANRTLHLSQAAYAECMLKLYGMWEANPAVTPLSPWMHLSKKDTPDYIDPALQRLYLGIVGHLGFLVTMTQCDLAFS